MSTEATEKPIEVLLCSDCFRDHGLSLDARSFGVELAAACPQCGSGSGRKLDRDRLLALAETFFVRGTLVRAEYGAAPVVQFNEHHHRKTEVDVNERLLKDANLLGEAAGVGFFHYGPQASCWSADSTCGASRTNRERARTFRPPDRPSRACAYSAIRKRIHTRSDT